MRVSPEALTEARVVAHHALRLAAALPCTHLTADGAAPDLVWDDALGALLGRPVGPLQFALRLVDLRWLALCGGGLVAERPVEGSTAAAALAWMDEIARARARAPVRAPSWAAPPHSVADGAPFPPTDLDARAVLAAQVARAAALLPALAVALEDPVARCAPEPFTVSVRIPADEGAIVAGLCLGDANTPLPWWFARWVGAQAEGRAELPLGRWEGGEARLTTPDLPAYGIDAAVRTFLVAAVAALRPAAAADDTATQPPDEPVDVPPLTETSTDDHPGEP